MHAQHMEVDADFELHITSYTAAINACAQVGKHPLAAEWLAKAVEAGLEPNNISYGVVMDTCANLDKQL